MQARGGVRRSRELERPKGLGIHDFDPAGEKPPTNGFVRLDMRRRSIFFGRSYEIDIDRVRTGAQVLDWVFQMNQKMWVADNDIRTFLCIVEWMAAHYWGAAAQGLFCPFGVARIVDEKGNQVSTSEERRCEKIWEWRKPAAGRRQKED